MRSARESAVIAEPPRKTRALRAAGAFAAILLAGCAGTSPGPFEEAEDLQAFLKGEAPVPEERAELARLNEAFARQSVRAHGYLREGVGDVPPDGWSPVVRREEGEGGEPADITPWIEGGDIDPAGRFAPIADLCEASGPASIEGIPAEELRIDGLQDRLNRLSCAIERIAGGETEIQWTEPSAAALSIAGPGGAARVNPRVLHLILPAGEGSAAPFEAPSLEPASAGPEDDEIFIDEGDINNHPRPDPDPEDKGGDTDAEDLAECLDACAVGCEILVAILDACAASQASSSSDASGGCDASVPGEKPDQAILFSLALVVSIGIRRRGKRRNNRSLFLAPLFFLLLNGGLARAQTPPKAPAPPPPLDAAEPAPPVPPKDWRPIYQEGMKKLEEKNYGDAILHLREAYHLDPTADKLEAIARAQRGAGQTHKAIQTLEHARSLFGESLTDEKYGAITAEIEKFKGELVTVRIITRPINATIFIDGEALPPGAAATPIEIGPGAHKFGASAEGYATGYRTVDIVPGRETRDVILNLPPNKLFLWVTAPYPSTTIAVDGEEVGRGEWSGFLEPGAHTVRLQQPDGTAQTVDVNGAAGQAIKVPDQGERLTYPGMPEPDRASRYQSFDSSDFADDPVTKPEFHETGSYLFANASILWHTTRLYGFREQNAVPGVAIGVRGGYRQYSNVSYEMLVEYSYFGVTDELSQYRSRDEDGDGYEDPLSARDDARYSIHDIRLGPVLRLMSSDPKHRGLFALGGGLLYEQIGLDHVDYGYNAATQAWDNEGIYHHDFSGFGAFVLAEAGYERSIGRLLLGGVFGVSLDAVSGIDGRPYDDTFNVRLGLSFRVGYSAWTLEQVREEKKKP
jgi:hypothetical protein